MWSYSLDLRSISLTVVTAVVSCEGTCNNCSFVKVNNYFSMYSYKILDFFTSNLSFLDFC